MDKTIALCFVTKNEYKNFVRFNYSGLFKEFDELMLQQIKL